MRRIDTALCTLALVAGGALLGARMAHAAATAEPKCQVAKLKAQGALQTCLAKNSGNLILGKADASAACHTKFAAALTKADKKGACRYIDNGDGTVSDLNTGLMWEQKDSLDGTANYSDVHDADNFYTWCIGTLPYCAGGTNPPDGTAYTDFLGTLNGGTSNDFGRTITGCFASHCDWRLPTMAELEGIFDRSTTGCGSAPFPPCIDPTFGPTQRSNHYWSATTVGAASNGAYIVGFDDDEDVFFAPKSLNNYVRAVRGGL